MWTLKEDPCRCRSEIVDIIEENLDLDDLNANVIKHSELYLSLIV